MSSKSDSHDASIYYVPHGSPWPILGSVALFTLMIGAVSFLNEWAGGWSFLPGALLLAFMFFGWFATVIGESEHGMYNMQVDKSFRMGMMWFIMSELMFFAAFFGALFYARQLSVPWIGGDGVKIFNKLLLWQDFNAAWPTNGPAKLGGHADGSFETIKAFSLPAINTAILLTSASPSPSRTTRCAKATARSWAMRWPRPGCWASCSCTCRAPNTMRPTRSWA
jgi:cytochrome c oxidase subunit 3